MTHHPSPLMPVALTLLVALGCGGAAYASGSDEIADHSPVPPSVAPADEAPEAVSHPFRMGTASGPFGPSTAIADFDEDGQLDFAVVDRRGIGSRGYEYRIEFLVSTAEASTVDFRSHHEALTVSVRDVDHDGDLDIVVTSPLKHEVVGVWLNDGGGRFEQADLAAFPTRLPPLRRLGSPHASVAAAPAIAPERRGHPTRLVRAALLDAPVAGVSVARPCHARVSSPRGSAHAPRAPPLFLL